MLILVLWCAIAVLSMLFIGKITTLFTSDAVQAISLLEAQSKTYTGGFSFVSVDGLTLATIESYLQALEQHLRSVKQKKTALYGGGNTKGEEGDITNGNGNGNGNGNAKANNFGHQREPSTVNQLPAAVTEHIEPVPHVLLSGRQSPNVRSITASVTFAPLPQASPESA